MKQFGAARGVRLGYDHAGLLVLHVEQHALAHGGCDGLAGGAQQYPDGHLLGERPADAGGTFAECLGGVAAVVFGEQQLHQAALEAQALAGLAGGGLGVAAYRLVDQAVQVLVSGVDEFVHRRWRDLDPLPDLGEAAPGEPDAEPVDRLERVEAAAVQALAAAELLEDLGVHAGAALGGLQVLHEDLDGAPDADQRHGLARVVEEDGQLRVLVPDLLKDLLGEHRRLGHRERRELAHLEPGDVPPGRARRNGPRAGAASALPRTADGGVASPPPRTGGGGVTSALPRMGDGGLTSALPRTAAGGVTSALLRTTGGGVTSALR